MRFTNFVALTWAILSNIASLEVIGDRAQASNGENGKRIFASANCIVCHAGGGNMMDPAHPIKGPAFMAKYGRDEVLEATIRKGFPEAGMPSQGFSQINALEMKDLIAYVRSFTAPSGRIQKTATNNTNNTKKAADVKQKLPQSSH